MSFSTEDKIVISGLSQLSVLGQGLSSLQQGLDLLKLPKAVERKVATYEGEKTIQVYFAEQVVLPHFIPDGVARRMSRLSKMCFTAVAEALNDAFGDSERRPERIGLVVGTAFGDLDLANSFQRRVQLEGLTGASPSLFAGSVQNSIAANLSITFNLQGPSTTVMTMEQTTIGSIHLAYDWLKQNLVDHVVVVIADEVSEYHAYLLSDQKQSSLQEAIRYDSDQCTTLLGEGAVGFVLSRTYENLVKNKYARIERPEFFINQNLNTERTFIGSYGRKNQWSQYKKNLPRHIDLTSHVQLYGSMITGIAFEIAIAAMKIATDGKGTTCIQLTDHDEIQSVRLLAN